MNRKKIIHRIYTLIPVIEAMFHRKKTPYAWTHFYDDITDIFNNNKCTCTYFFLQV